MSADVWLEQMQMTSLDDTHFNLTYNLSPMLREAGMPEWSQMVGMPAREAGPIWQAVFKTLRDDPERFQAMNPPNGWGNYEQAVQVIEQLAKACEKHPDATVGGWL